MGCCSTCRASPASCSSVRCGSRRGQLGGDFRSVYLEASEALAIPQTGVVISEKTGGLDFSAGLGFLGLSPLKDLDGADAAGGLAASFQTEPPKRQRKKKVKGKSEAEKTKQDLLIEERRKAFDIYIMKNPSHIIEIANDCDDSIGRASLGV